MCLRISITSQNSEFKPHASSKRSMFSTLISWYVIKGVEINPIGFMISIYLKTPIKEYYYKPDEKNLVQPVNRSKAQLFKAKILSIAYSCAFAQLCRCVLIHSQTDLFLLHYFPHINQGVSHPTQCGIDTYTCNIGNLFKAQIGVMP
jgi:hypothetical protein